MGRAWAELIIPKIKKKGINPPPLITRHGFHLLEASFEGLGGAHLFGHCPHQGQCPVIRRGFYLGKAPMIMHCNQWVFMILREGRPPNLSSSMVVLLVAIPARSLREPWVVLVAVGVGVCILRLQYKGPVGVEVAGQGFPYILGRGHLLIRGC